MSYTGQSTSLCIIEIETRNVLGQQIQYVMGFSSQPIIIPLVGLYISWIYNY